MENIEDLAGENVILVEASLLTVSGVLPDEEHSLHGDIVSETQGNLSPGNLENNLETLGDSNTEEMGSEDGIRQKKKQRTFTHEFKLKVVEFAEQTSNRNAAKQFRVDPKSVREWRKKKEDCGLDESQWDKRDSADNSNRNRSDQEEGSDVASEDNASDDDEDRFNQVIKISPSDIEMDETSNLENDNFFDPNFSIKEEQASSDESSYSSSTSESSVDEEDDDYSPRKRRRRKPARYDSDDDAPGKIKSELETDPGFTDTDGEGVRKGMETRKRKRKVTKKTESNKQTKSSKPPSKRKGRGRPKAPRRLDGTDAVTTDEDEDPGFDQNTPIRTGSGYRIDFKMRVLKYAETHSNSATAEKFGVNAKRIREWKRAKDKIGLEKDGVIKRRPRSAGFTVQEKLQAIQFAKERSTDEARLLYGVDRRTIEKWRANSEKLEARLKSGQGDALRDGAAGRKPRFTHIEDKLRDWVIALRLKGVTVNCRMILNKAGKLLAEEPKPEHQNSPIKAPRTWSWVIGFLKRQNLMGLLGTTLGHEDPRELLAVDLKNAGDDLAALAHQQIEIPENPNKRHRRSISLQDKINIINRIEKGETQGIVAKSLGVATSTVQTIWSCRNDLLRRYLNPKAKPKSAAFLWKKYSVISKVLIDWYEQCAVKNMQIDGKALFDKSMQLSETYRLAEEFRLDAKEWFKQFCKRNKLMEKCNEIFPQNTPSTTTSTNNTVTAGPSIPPPNISSAVHQESTFEHSAASAEDFHHTEADFNDFLSDFRNNENFEQKTSVSVNTPMHNSTTVAHQLQQQPLPNLTLVPHPTSTLQNRTDQQINSIFGINNSTPIASVLSFPTTVTITDALKYLGFVRSWIAANYGPNDSNLNHHLSAIENAIFKKRPN